MTVCKYCFHSNFTDPPLDDLEASCDCDCHCSPDEDEIDDEPQADDMEFF